MKNDLFEKAKQAVAEKHEFDDDSEFDECCTCSFCGRDNDEHVFGCPENIDPFQNYIEDGFA